MIKDYFYYDSQRRVVMIGSGLAVPDVAPFPEWTLIEGRANVGQYVDESNQPHDRPLVSHGWAATGAAPMTLVMGALPAGTTIVAINEAGEFVLTDDPADPIILMDPETYTVAINPPWPYLPETLTIEVT